MTRDCRGINIFWGLYYPRLPDNIKPEFDEESHFSQFKRHNIVFNALASKSYRVRHVGCLSVKTILSGEEWYEVNNRPLAVRPGQFLILNDSQDYYCQVDTAGEVRIQSVFFQAAFASSIFRVSLTREDSLLDNPFEAGEQLLEFFPTLYAPDSSVTHKPLN